MRFKLDENLGRRGALLLREAGHEVETVLEEGLCSAADPVLMNACRSEGRCLVSLDLGFSNPLVFAPWEQAGIAVLRVSERATEAEIHAALRSLIAGLRDDDITGKLWIIEVGRIRKHQGERDDAEGNSRARKPPISGS